MAGGVRRYTRGERVVSVSLEPERDAAMGIAAVREGERAYEALAAAGSTTLYKSSTGARESRPSSESVARGEGCADRRSNGSERDGRAQESEGGRGEREERPRETSSERERDREMVIGGWGWVGVGERGGGERRVSRTVRALLLLLAAGWLLLVHPYSSRLGRPQCGLNG